MEAKWTVISSEYAKRGFKSGKKKLNRPQEPKGKLPYQVKEVSFKNIKEDIRFSGTLTLPENPEAAVILISGSGPQDRNQLSMGHKTFLVLADFLSRNNIAVLRYDDRGVGKSEGEFDTATSYNFAEDASAAINFLKGVEAIKGLNVGAIGHSEGGLIAPVLVKNNENVDFIVLLAGPSRSGKFVSENQMLKILMSNGVSREAAIGGSKITKSLNDTIIDNRLLSTEELKKKLTEAYSDQWEQLPSQTKEQLRKLGGGKLTDARINMLISDWYFTFLTHEPLKYLKEIKVPVLSLFAEKDVQVSSSDHFQPMKTALRESGNPYSKVSVLLDHNHMFQTAKTGAMSEYQQIEETMSIETLDVIDDWIKNLK